LTKFFELKISRLTIWNFSFVDSIVWRVILAVSNTSWF